MQRPARTPAQRLAGLPAPVSEAVAHAAGWEHREDPTLPGTGGPSGNAQLTAWTGLFLLALIVAELATLISVRHLVAWHIAIGAALIPPALLKTATTGWRMVRYYTGSPVYTQAGPPPLLMRLLGPLVVLSTLGVLATGTVLALLGSDSSRRPLLTVLGFSVSWLTVHQGSFIVWGAVTGLHVLGRFVPALHAARSPRGGHDGGGKRVAMLVGTAVAASAAAALLLSVASSWDRNDGGGRADGRHLSGSRG